MTEMNRLLAPAVCCCCHDPGRSGDVWAGIEDM